MVATSHEITTSVGKRPTKFSESGGKHHKFSRKWWQRTTKLQNVLAIHQQLAEFGGTHQQFAEDVTAAQVIIRGALAAVQVIISGVFTAAQATLATSPLHQHRLVVTSSLHQQGLVVTTPLSQQGLAVAAPLCKPSLW